MTQAYKWLSSESSLKGTTLEPIHDPRRATLGLCALVLAMPEPWRSFLNELDRIANSTVRLDCIGGFVVTMLYGLSRSVLMWMCSKSLHVPRQMISLRSRMLGGPLFL